MPASTQTADPLATLLRLRKLRERSVCTFDEAGRILRFDRPAVRMPGSSSRTRPRAAPRPTSLRPTSPRRSANAEPASDTTGDLTHAHSMDLLEQLRQWSMELDRREAELDDRECQLNRRLRLARQIES